MKILFLARRFYPQIGGVEKHVYEITKILVAKGHEVVIVTADFKGPSKLVKANPNYQHNNKQNYQSSAQSDTYSININYPVKSIQSEKIVSKKIKIIRLNFGKNNIFVKLKIWLSMGSVVREILNADVIHCHDVFFWYLPFRFLFPGKKVFTTFHGYEEYPLGRGKILMHKISEILSNGNICVGKFIEKWYGTSSDAIIYGGVESKSKNKKSNIKYMTSALFYGRLDEQTGILEYAKAAKLIKNAHPEFRFEIIGEGKYRKKVEKFVKKGFVKNPEKYLPDFRFAFLSRYLSILEAMIAKRLIFALFDNPIKRDYLQISPFSKWIVICGSAAELASKVEFFMANKQEEVKMTNLAYDWAKKQTWENVVSVYLKLWKKS